jgi:hypothetical protein
MTANYTRWPYIILNGHKIFQMVIKYTNIYHSKAIQNLPKFGIFGLKTKHLATLAGGGKFAFVHVQCRKEHLDRVTG